MTSLNKLIIFWPFFLAVVLIIFLTSTLIVWYKITILRSGIVIGFVLLFLASFSSTSYTNPNNWMIRPFYSSIVPSMKELQWTIKDKSGFDHSRQAIYIWYPHSHFATVPFALLAGNMAPDIFKRPTSICAAPPLLDIPAIRQLSLNIGAVRSDYNNMSSCLKQGTSILILPGGAREVLLTRLNEVNLIDGRKGFLKLAQDTGLPLVPIFCFGENEFFGNAQEESKLLIHRVLKKMGGGFQVPSWKSFKEWINKSSHNPVNIHIGKPLVAGGDKSVEDLQKQWKTHINRFYKSVRPKSYSARINWISIKGSE